MEETTTQTTDSGHELTIGLTEFSCSCGAYGVIYTRAQLEALEAGRAGCPRNLR